MTRLCDDTEDIRGRRPAGFKLQRRILVFLSFMKCVYDLRWLYGIKIFSHELVYR